MIPLIINNKNKCREEINRSTSDITGAAGGGSPQTYKSTCGRGRGEGGEGLRMGHVGTPGTGGFGAVGLGG